MNIASVDLISASILLFALSGIPGLFMRPLSSLSVKLNVILVLLASSIGFTGIIFCFINPDPSLYLSPWPAVGGGLVGVDAISAFFLCPVFLVGALGSVYSIGYWSPRAHPRTARSLRAFWGLALAGMSLLIIGRHSMSFLLGWEIMALSAFFLVSTEDEKSDSRKSALVYLIATHVGTLALFGFFCLWKHATGSFDLVPAASGSIPAITANILICLGLFGFGLKAGSMPLHFWLPGAHANAPSHVSALLSAVMLKMGIYGIVRLFMLLPGFSPFWAWFILVLGLFSGLLGVVLAIAQHDIKRLLAYHSVENIGIILMGLGMALLGRIYHREEWVVLGMAGCLLHVWNHAIFKSLLFFGAGSVLHATGTRQLDRLGGLARKMPFTAASFLLGAAAICGLPPLNGFISEFFIYVGFFSSAVSAKSLSSIALLGAPVLAMIGALAVSCFVKAYGAVFLGSPRSACAARSRESSLSMLIPMGVLSLLCVVIGLCPFLTIPVLEKSIGVWLAAPPTMTLSELIPFPALGIVLPVAVVLIALSIVFVIVRARSRAKKTVTWDCGYAKSGARIQYTASSFARSLVDIFSWFLKPRNHLPRLEENFPVAETLDSHVEDPVLDRHLIPDFNFLRNGSRWFNRFQQGQTQLYVLYLVLMLGILLVTLIPFKQLFFALFTK